jgi:hypothetical protein
MVRRSCLLGCATLTLALAVATGCGGAGDEASPTLRAARQASQDLSANTSVRSNQRRLSRAQSLQLVAWATKFRACEAAAGIELGPLQTDETQIAMKLPASVDVQELLRKMVVCGDRLGGPPRKSSLQYQPGKVILYLPKQCLLDKKVAAS